LAYSLDHLDLVVEQLQGCEVAIGSRNLTTRHVKGLKLSRQIADKVFNILSYSLLNLQYRDMQAGLKGFQKSAAKAIFKRQALTGFSFDVELIYVAKKRGYAIAEVPAIVSDDHQQKLSKVNLLQDSIKMLIDLLKVRWNDVMGRYQ
jgi:dolichyl-phosphate beta-glucosyltransferase